MALACSGSARPCAQIGPLGFYIPGLDALSEASWTISCSFSPSPSFFCAYTASWPAPYCVTVRCERERATTILARNWHSKARCALTEGFFDCS